MQELYIAKYEGLPSRQDMLALEKFVSLTNLPKPMTSNNYEKIINKLIVATKDVGEAAMQDACKELRGDSTGIVDAAVSC